jgi:hypothetical protein
MMYLYFANDDWKCGCGCGLDVDEEVKSICDRARAKAGIPFLITSGARCLEHNYAIGSRPTSSHIEGLACDIKASTSQQRFAIIKALIDVGVERIGINFDKGFIHFDIDYSKPKELIFGY